MCLILIKWYFNLLYLHIQILLSNSIFNWVIALLMIINSDLGIFNNQNEIPKLLKQQHQEIITKPITF
jgi:hypothetical protein